MACYRPPYIENTSILLYIKLLTSAVGSNMSSPPVLNTKCVLYGCVRQTACGDFCLFAVLFLFLSVALVVAEGIGRVAWEAGKKKI